MADTPVSQGVDFTTATGVPFPENLKKDGQVPLWWRRISSKVFESNKISYLKTGQFPSLKTEVEEEIRILLEGDGGPKSFMGRYHKPALLAVLTAIDRKLAFILKLAMADIPHLTLSQVKISPKGLAFFDTGSNLAINDLLEMQIPLFTEYPLLVSCYARVAMLQPDVKRGRMQVICRFESPGGTLGTEVVTPPPPLVFRTEPPVVERATVVTHPPVVETPVPVVEEKKPAVDHVPVSAGHRSNNRRQSFRINGILTMSWRLIESSEFALIEKEYNSNRKILQREVEYQYQERIISLDFHLLRLEEGQSKAVKSFQYLRQQVDLLFRRSNTLKEEKFYLEMLGLLQTMVEELNRVEVTAKLVNLIFCLKIKFELQLERDRMDFRTDPKKKQEIPLQLKKVGREIDKGMGDAESVGPVFQEAVLQFLDHLNTMNTSLDDLPLDGDDPLGTMISRSINLSVTGLAFRTKKLDIQRGDMIEYQLGFVPEGEVPVPRDLKYCYGRVVLIKEPDIDKRIRVATEFAFLSAGMQEEIYKYIAQLQRDRLSTRIETFD